MRCIEKSSLVDAGVSVVVPVLNGARWLPDVLAAIRVELERRPHEILVVDDGSSDESVEICRRIGDASLQIVDGPRRGAAAAVNTGLRVARFDLVAQIDQDVIVRPGWFDTLIDALGDPHVAAAQGWYCTDPAAPALARVMSIDLEQRYARIDDGRSDHVCTGNVIWRLDALRHVGGLDETLGYGYDNDLSYRLIAAGYRLVIRREAESVHRWRDGVASYLTQQYGFGYGRLDLVARHRNRVAGDAVSPPMMMAHPVLMAAALAALVGAGICGLAGRPAAPWWLASAAVIGLLVVERAIAGVVATRRFGDPAALLFPAVHLLRDLAWVAAMARWLARRIVGAPWAPRHSMQPRTADRGAVDMPAAEER
jgi:mycofactocin glycosyltransferase